MTTSTPTHPADTIVSSTSFTQFCDRYIAACEHEVRIAANEPNWARCDHWLKNAALAHKAKTVANLFVRDFAIEVMYMTGACDFAEALESGDYSKLAF